MSYFTSPQTGYYGANVNGTSLSCSGQIETKWKWNPSSPTAPVPQQVIIKQLSNATWESKTTTGKCSDGLTNPTDTPTTSTSQSGDTTSTSSGTHYSLAPADGSGNVTVDCTPTASVSSGSCGVYYQASLISPVSISLAGATPDASGNQNILVGQGCTASLSGIPSGCTVSNYQSSVSGSTFEDWESTTTGNQSANPPIPANSQASYYDAGPGTETNSTYHWYWNDIQQKTETVKCTATVTPPAGEGSAFPVTATQNVTVYVPKRVMNTNVAGNGLILKSTMIAEQTPGMMNNGQDFGSSWATAISMPPAPAPNFGAGQWCYCQLITPGEYVSSGGMQLETTDTQKGVGLDAAFPFNNPSANAATESADGNTYHNGDSPYLGPLDSTYDSATLTDTLNTYLMFQPPANSTKDVKWVALSESTWSTDFMAYIPAGGWSTYPSTASVGSIKLNPNFTSGNTFPKWTQIVPTGQAQTFVPYQ